MSEFNYKDFLKNSSFLNEAEEKEEDKVSEDRIEKAIKAVLKKEGGAAGVKPLVDAAKELGASKKDLMDVLKKMKSVETHKDGDIIDTDGLNESAAENLELKSFARQLFAYAKKNGAIVKYSDFTNPDKVKQLGKIEKTGMEFRQTPHLYINVEKDYIYVNMVGDGVEKLYKDMVSQFSKLEFGNYKISKELFGQATLPLISFTVKSKTTGKKGGLVATEGLKEEEENLEEAEESVLSREKKMVMKLLLGKMQDIENANPEELTRDFLIKTKNMIDDLMISDF